MNYFNYLLELTRQDLKERFAGSVLGILWVFIWPLVQLFIYVIIFGKIMGGRLPGNSEVYAYGIYAACGLIPWTCFANTLLRISKVLIERKHIITKIPTKLFFFPLYIVISETIPFIFSIIVLIVVTYVTGVKVQYQYLPVILLVYYTQQVFAYGLGLFFATMSVFIRDVKELVDVIVQLWFWFTPIVYTTNILPAFAKDIVIINPMYAIVESMHNIFVFQTAPPWHVLSIVFIGSHALLLFSFWLLRKLEADVRDFL